MNKQREALHIALEALEQYGTSSLNNEDEYSAAIKKIREALAEPEQEAAPDLLEALKSIVGDSSIQRVSDDLHKKARAAIAKAKGEA